MGELGHRSEMLPGREEAAALAALKAEVDLQRKTDSSQSYLSKAIDFVWRKDEEALDKLTATLEQAQQMIRAGDRAGLSRLGKEIPDLVRESRDELQLQSEMASYGGGFAKAIPLFMTGPAALLATAGLFALDQMRPGDRLPAQAIDGTLGAVKGLALKGTLQALSGSTLPVALRGMTLGTTARILEAGLTRETYAGGSSGGFDLKGGLAKVTATALNPYALASDAVVFTLSHGMIGGADAITRGAIKASPFLRTMLTGTTMGLSSGAAGEVARQVEAGEKFDYAKIAGRSLLQGALNTLAAIPGAFQNQMALSKLKESQEETVRAAEPESRPAPGSDAARENGGSRRLPVWSLEDKPKWPSPTPEQVRRVAGQLDSLTALSERHTGPGGQESALRDALRYGHSMVGRDHPVLIKVWEQLRMYYDATSRHSDAAEAQRQISRISGLNSASDQAMANRHGMDLAVYAAYLEAIGQIKHARHVSRKAAMHQADQLREAGKEE